MLREAIPNFWPMRTFIHHNPLHGLEHLPFAEAAEQGARLFGARVWLPRAGHQRFLAEGKVDVATLRQALRGFLAGTPRIGGLDLGFR